MPIEVLSAHEMRRAEAAAFRRGVPSLAMMERAGEAAAAEAARDLRAGARVLVACGPGNNGGDGYVVARDLAARGHAVTVAALGRDRLTGDARTVAERWNGGVSDLEEVPPHGFDLVVDALFGLGLSRDLDGAVAAWVEAVNASRSPILALDIPSGVDSDTGRVRGAAIRAARTVTFARHKPGHLLYPGRELCGAVSVVEIEVTEVDVATASPSCFINGPALWGGHLPRLAAAGHKYDRGHALVLSGGPAHTGAARMAARGALRAGAGLVSLVVPPDALAIAAAQLTAIMLRPCAEPDDLADLLTDERFNALLLGPALGVGEATRRWVEAALEADRATVLDADALTSFSGAAESFAALVRGERARPVVLTPHAGEFGRLLAGPGEPSLEARAAADAPSKLAMAREAAAFTGAIVVLKGPDTVIAAPDGRAAINANGSPFLATAGSGDVLGGIVTGLLAQGMPAFGAASAAVWLHAAAAERHGPGLIAEDLPELLPTVLRDLL